MFDYQRVNPNCYNIVQFAEWTSCFSCSATTWPCPTIGCTQLFCFKGPDNVFLKHVGAPHLHISRQIQIMLSAICSTTSFSFDPHSGWSCTQKMHPEKTKTCHSIHSEFFLHSHAIASPFQRNLAVIGDQGRDLALQVLAFTSNLATQQWWLSPRLFHCLEVQRATSHLRRICEIIWIGNHIYI